MKNAPATEVNEGAKSQRHITSPREKRVLQALLSGPESREQIDAIAHASNGPDVVYRLRNYGLEIVTERVPCVTHDGVTSWFGRYHFVGNRAEAREMLREVRK